VGHILDRGSATLTMPTACESSWMTVLLSVPVLMLYRRPSLAATVTLYPTSASPVVANRAGTAAAQVAMRADGHAVIVLS